MRMSISLLGKVNFHKYNYITVFVKMKIQNLG